MGQEKSVPIRCNTTCHKYSSSIKKSDSLSASTLNLKSDPISKFHKTAPSPSTRSPSRNTAKSTKSSQSTKSTHHSSHHRHTATRKTSSPSSSSSCPYKSNTKKKLTSGTATCTIIIIQFRHCRRQPNCNYFTFSAGS